MPQSERRHGPLRFRPEDDPRNDPDDPVEWVDNRFSNSLAWASYRATPLWCQVPEHPTSRITDVVWTSCPCCLLMRGLLIGVTLSAVLWLLIGVGLWALLTG